MPPACQKVHVVLPAQSLLRARHCHWRAGRLVAMAAQPVGGVMELATKYKGILLDQFGVLHDGKQAYGGAVEAVKYLAEAGLSVVILSNSSRRSDAVIPKLAKMGFDQDAFAGAVTSGEVAHRSLENRQGDFWKNLGTKCIHLTWGARGQVTLGDLDLEVVTAPDQADFILASGTEALGHGDDAPAEDISLDGVRQLLEQCAARGGIPMLVANPDVVTVSRSGLIPMPGTFAQWYAKLGGEVHLLGKPAPVIYETAMDMLGLPADQVLAVGDSIEHDIAGAVATGVDSLFIAGGIDAEPLGVTPEGGPLDSQRLSAWLSKQECQPTYAMAYLQR